MFSKLYQRIARTSLRTPSYRKAEESVALRSRGLRWILLALLSLGQLGLSAGAQPAPDLKKLVADAVYNEKHPAIRPQRMSFHRRTVEDGKATTKLIVETTQGDVFRTIALNDKPLDTSHRQEEDDRLADLMAHPDKQLKRYKKEQEDSQREDKLVDNLTVAFLYTYAGMVKAPSGMAYRLTFVPNPDYHPSDRESQVFHGMKGELWIDQRQCRMVRFDARLMEDVNFGWGFVGRLRQGGTILVENQDVGEGRWETVHLKLDLQAKVLMLATLNFKSIEDTSNYQIVPHNMTYQQGIEILNKSK